jgi:alpha-galactosidase
MSEFKIEFEKIIFKLDKNYEFFEKENETSNFEFSIKDNFLIVFKPKEKIYLKKVLLVLNILEPKNFHIFRNGFQSWSPSYPFYNKIKEDTPLIPILKYHYLDPENLNPNISFIFTYLKGEKNYLIFYPKDFNFYNYFVFDDRKITITFEIYKKIENDMNLEVEIYEKENPIENFDFSKKVFGWTSWYYYYRKIIPDEIFKNIDSIDRIPFKINFFQIDDGWQKSIGDWNENEKFIGFFEKFCEKLNKKEILPGIWVAPFIVEKNSEIFKHRKDLIMKNREGKIFPVGFNPLWSGYFYALDISKEEVQDRILNDLERLRKIGFKLFKLDFLYAGFIKSLQDESRYEKFIKIFKEIRYILRDSTILGCGVPFILFDDIFDIVRIGPDTMDGWKNRLMRFISFPGRVEAYNSLRNTLFRNVSTKQRFLFDPDVIFLKPKKLNKVEKETIILTNYLLSNIIFFSDPIYSLNDEDFSLLRELLKFKKIELFDFSFDDEFMIYKFNIDNFKYLFLVNLSDKIVDLSEKGILIDGLTILKPHESKLIKI